MERIGLSGSGNEEKEGKIGKEEKKRLRGVETAKDSFVAIF